MTPHERAKRGPYAEDCPGMGAYESERKKQPLSHSAECCADVKHLRALLAQQAQRADESERGRVARKEQLRLNPRALWLLEHSPEDR